MYKIYANITRFYMRDLSTVNFGIHKDSWNQSSTKPRDNCTDREGETANRDKKQLENLRKQVKFLAHIFRGGRGGPGPWRRG
jgi:hypothetical protein